MGRPPAYLFVVRHGNRLDAADKQWHMTSPTPYDPPLTYGGWLQCQRLGARIASILQEKEAEDEAARAEYNNGLNGSGKQPKKKKRYRVVLHSSPFLRCIQTSVAISAGIASSPSPFTQSSDVLPARLQPSSRPQTPISSIPVSPRTRPALVTDIPPAQPTQSSNHLEKTTLRLDPFLGEWASPDYFDHITPPPKSSLMLGTAKAELLRKENHIPYYTESNPRPGTPTTPSRLWNSPTQSRNSTLDGFPKPGDSAFGSINNEVSERRGSHKVSNSESAIATGYAGPVPGYAISPSEPIPQGYVAHARDACVDIDYQWDSSRDPISWGDGGVLPEEWAAMHHRFRKGLKRLVDWYTTADHPGQMVTKTPTTPNPSRFDGNGAAGQSLDDEYDIEDVVILVSHGAGCNALVGGITNQPVLADVPMASLSVARRRPGFEKIKKPADRGPLTSLDDGLSRKQVTVQELYELSMFANTDHLVRSANVSRSSSVTGGSRGHSRGLSSALRDINFGAYYGQPHHRSNSMSSSLGGARKMSGTMNAPIKLPPLISNGAAPKGGITVGSGVTSFGAASRKNSRGLWTPKQEPVNPEEDPDLPMTLDFSHEKESKKTSPPPGTIVEMPEHEHDHQLPPLPASIDNEKHDKVEPNTSIPPNSGMWGSPRPPDDAETLRDFSSQKRRWTVTERQL
ncbi:hypothetical protein KJ359_012310 [Pestalotiopsis sp. 9143b]|nr:hypothetical protein KJ359_012310 [Pestalotiopsis sp. 9143b]